MSILFAALAFAKKHYEALIIIAIIVTAALALYAMGRNHERERWKPKVTVLEAQLSQLKENYRVAGEQQRLELLRVQQEGKLFQERLVAHYEQRVHSHQAVADSLRGELRRTRASLRPLAPAEAAPAACGDYEADRTKLPARDQDFLVDLAKRCDVTATTLRSCQEYAVNLYGLCSAQP